MSEAPTAEPTEGVMIDQEMLDKLVTAIEQVESIQAEMQDLKTKLDEMAGRDEAAAEAVTEEVTAEIESMQGQLAAMQGQLGQKTAEIASLQTQMARKSPGFNGLGGQTRANYRSIGHALSSDSDLRKAVQHAAKHKSGNHSLIEWAGDKKDPPKVGGLLKHLARMRQKGNIWDDGVPAASITAMESITGYRDPNIELRAREDVVLLDMVSHQAISDSVAYFVRQTGFSEMYCELTAQAAAGQKDMTVDNANGFYAGQVIQIGPTSGTYEALEVDSVTVDATGDSGTVTATTNLVNTYAIASPITADFFVFTAATNVKPRAEGPDLEAVSCPVKTLAHHETIARQNLDDFSALRAIIDDELMYGLMSSLEQQILNGDGTGESLTGILNTAGILAYSWSSGEVGDTRIDAIRRAIGLARLANRRVDTLVVHPNDKIDLDLTKDSNGQYLWVNIRDASGADMLWRLTVVETTAIAEGTALIGAFRAGYKLYDREQGSITVSYDHEDYRTRNLALLLAELRVCGAVRIPEAFVKVTLDSAPSASS